MNPIRGPMDDLHYLLEGKVTKISSSNDAILMLDAGKKAKGCWLGEIYDPNWKEQQAKGGDGGEQEGYWDRPARREGGGTDGRRKDAGRDG